MSAKSFRHLWITLPLQHRLRTKFRLIWCDRLSFVFAKRDVRLGFLLAGFQYLHLLAFAAGWLAGLAELGQVGSIVYKTI